MVTELRAGMLVGRYRLQGRIAQGGMGSVWSARDERLERLVAIKMLPRILVTDSAAERRFEREARAMGRLQHPNVVSIFDVGAADPGTGEDLPYLVMELISGHSLDKMIAHGPLPVPLAARIVGQVARALAAAHAAGIVHRDLKPSNVMVVEEDHVKVLDFGLARLLHREGQKPEDTLTTPGMVLGSCPYMAPEQALGLDVTAASDLFSCGSVLYEALSGRRAFDGSTPMKVLQKVVRCEFPPLLEVAPHVPAEMAAVVERCMEKEPEDRFSGCAAVARNLAAFTGGAEHSSSGVPTVTIVSDVNEPGPERRPRVMLAALAAAATGVAAGALIVGSLVGRGTEVLRPDPGRWRVEQVVELNGVLRHPTWGPRDSELAFDQRVMGRSEIAVVSPSGGDVRLLVAADDREAVSSPRYSPDGNALVVSVTEGEHNLLRVYPVVGGEPYAEIENARNGSWLDENRIVFSRRSDSSAQLWTYDVHGSEESVFRPADGPLRWWAFLDRPGAGFAALGGPSAARRGIYVFQGPDTSPVEWLAPSGQVFGMSWAPGGRSLAASLDGRLVKIDEDHVQSLLPDVGKLWDPSFSGDGRRLAVVEQRMTNDLIAVDPDGGGWSCMVCGLPNSGFGSLATDGTVCYRRLVNGVPRLMLRRPGASDVQLEVGGDRASCPSFSPDGKLLAYLKTRQGEGVDLRVVALEGGSPVTLSTGVESSEYPSWSPDGRFIAYAGGAPVQAWVVPVVGGEPRPVGPEGGDYPVFSPDGQWIAFVVWTDAADPRQGAWIVPAIGGEAERVSRLPSRVFWDPGGRHLRQLRRGDDRVELWQRPLRGGQWEMRSQLDIGMTAPMHLEYLPLTSDPASDRLIMNRRSSVSSLLVFDGVDPDRW